MQNGRITKLRLVALLVVAASLALTGVWHQGVIAQTATPILPFINERTLVSASAWWRYRDDGSNQGTGWRDISFDDGSWSVGRAQLGYGDGDEATIVSFGADAATKYITTYFRHSFQVLDASLYSALTLNIVRDDGAVVYLNGLEVFRSNMPAAVISHNTLATSEVGGDAESTFVSIALDAGLLVDGPNLIAVEVHQVSVMSSDISFDLELSVTSATGACDATIRFAVIGNFGEAGQPELDVSNLVKSWNPDFIITTGDNNYSNGAASTIDTNIGQYYSDFIFPYVGSYGPGAGTNRFFPSLGNHDWVTPGAQPYLDYFALPGNERYYDFVRGPVHFFAIDSDSNEPDGQASTSVQGSWLQSSLSTSTAPWKLVYFHHPPYTSSSVHAPKEIMKWPFYAWGLDAILTGHNHQYERLVLDGIPYFVNGLGGRPSIYSFGSPVQGSVTRYNADYGAMLAEAGEDCIAFQFVAQDGTVIDSYSMYKTINYQYFIYLPLSQKP